MESLDISRTSFVSRWAGALVCLALVAIVAQLEGGVVGPAAAWSLSGLALAAGLVWALRSASRLRRLSELYVWLAFIFSMYHLQIVSNVLASWTGLGEVVAYRSVAVLHVLAVAVALGGLGAWSKRADGRSRERSALGILILGAVVFWVGARTFPGMALEQVHENLPGHLWTAACFLAAVGVTLVGLTLLTLALREAGDRYFAVVGLLLFTFGAVFWVLHLVFRMTVQVDAVEIWHETGSAPSWLAPWSGWASVLFGLYSVLAYFGLAAYGGAFLVSGRWPRWVGWTFVLAGFAAAPLGGLPLFIHVPPWLAGLSLLGGRRAGPAGGQGR